MKKNKSQNVFQELDFSEEESRVLTLKAQLGALILKVVKQKKLTQTQLGKLWEVSQPRVSEIMTGKLNLISIERLVHFLDLLGVEVMFQTRSHANSAMRKKAG